MAKKQTHAVLVYLELKHKDILQRLADQDHRKLANLAAKVLRDFAEEQSAAKPKSHVNGHEHKVAKASATA